MAKYIGLLTSDMRGKLGGLVTSRSRSATTLKAHAVPTRTASPLQSARRMQFSQALYAWRQLDASQVASWQSLAAMLTWSNSLAQTFTPTGLQLWQQAFVNASLLGRVPPSSAPSSPPSVVPVLSATITGSTAGYLIAVSPASGTYEGAFLAFVSRPIQPSVTYTASIKRVFGGGNPGGNYVIVYPNFGPGYGPLPPVGSYVALRILPIDPTTYISGTEFRSIIVTAA